MSEEKDTQEVEKERCENCRFWWIEDGSDGILIGECRRRSPSIVTGLSLQLMTGWHAIPGENLQREDIDGKTVSKAIWPETREHDWCGEWQKLQASGSQVETNW